ncbi:glycosyltransferase family A protein [Hyphomicrobium sp.]|jgi:glycosyltransferase involved in cell wall biosynthesis|uniref:glycosyltransferase family 2 protein n=1 Tax=Hyphomicrobium sp. TaxID=82 RepID=UPI002C2FDE21|nr:glycosyltransferase family A protein [Hyphomicrobium sp.]HVZ05649.1 glycosyltransferase family A protein [Hyphomicrobium sp.]
MGVMISLIVCTLGREASLRRLLTSLSEQTYSPYEIIVADQNPIGYLDLLLDAYPSLPIIRVRSEKGLSRGRNVGLKRASGTIIGFPDDDCWYDRHVLPFVDDFFASNPEIDLLSGRTLDADGNDSVNRYAPESGPITRANVFATGNSNTIFIRREAANAVQGFDETLGVGASTPFQAGEESDFLLRCLDRGHRGFYDRTFTVRHDQVHESAERLHTYSVGFGRVARLHNLGPSLFLARNVRTVLGGCLRMAKGDFEGARQRYICLTGSMRGYVAPLPVESTRPAADASTRGAPDGT